MRSQRRLAALSTRACVLAVLACLLGLIQAGEEARKADEASGVVRPRREWAGEFAGTARHGPKVIRDEAEWRSFWQEVTGNYSPAPALPAVDFGREMVVAWLGGRSVGPLRDVGEFQMRMDGPRLEVRVAVYETPGSPVMVNNPFRIAVVPSCGDVDWHEAR